MRVWDINRQVMRPVLTYRPLLSMVECPGNIRLDLEDMPELEIKAEGVLMWSTGWVNHYGQEAYQDDFIDGHGLVHYEDARWWAGNTVLAFVSPGRKIIGNGWEHPDLLTNTRNNSNATN